MVWIDRYKNSDGILSPAKYWDTPILIVWAGWIGSVVTVCLAKMWMRNITVIDFDEVEDHNLQSQFYREQDIGRLKVEALKDIVKEQAWVDIKIINDKYNKKYSLWMDVVCTLVDNNDVRKEIVDSLLWTKHIIDCRMAWTFFQTYNFSSSEKGEYYDEFWFPQSEATEVICSEKSSCFNCFMSGANVCAVIRSRLIGHDIPSMMEMDCNLYMYNTKY